MVRLREFKFNCMDNPFSVRLCIKEAKTRKNTSQGLRIKLSFFDFSSTAMPFCVHFSF